MAHIYNRSFLDNLPGAIIVSDSDTKVLYSNKAVEDILKMPRNELRHMRLADRVYPADRKKVQRYAEMLQYARHMVTQRRFKDGEGKYVVIERNTQLLEDGNQLSICRLIDIDSIRAYEDRDSFAAMAGHELRNPLAGTQLNLDLLATQIKNSKNKDKKSALYMKTLIRNVQYYVDLQGRMINNLLSFSQLRKKKVVLQKEMIDMRVFLSKVVRQVRITTQRTCSLTLLKNAPKFVYADKDRLYQVCMNLLANAVKFSDLPSPIRVIVDRKRGMCRIGIVDKGIGIEKNYVRRIFKDFYQVQQKQVSGLGIGLYITNEIVRLHGGSLQVESEGLNRGSTFTVHLPLKG